MTANGRMCRATAAISSGARASPQNPDSSRPFPFCILRFFLLPLLLAAAPANAAPIPMDQIGAVAGKQYQGDGLSVAATPEGARLRCVFQKLEGEATPEGLWLTSTTDTAKADRFRVMAVTVGRQQGGRASLGGRASPPALTRARCQEKSGLAGTLALPGVGKVEVAGQVARFARPGLTEEYSVSMDGIRQDFLIERPPLNPRLLAASEQSADGSTLNQLHVELEVTGARVEPLANGARLVLPGSGRKIAYTRLRATDARGRELPARMVVPANSALRTPHCEIGLAVLVDDEGAEYPVRIDPTFSDENWISLNPSVPGVNDWVYAAVLDGAGNLYIGGTFTVAGGVLANSIARWDGTRWSALGSGVLGSVYALAVSSSNVYAGGQFTTAGGSPANAIAKWDGSTWSALGSGMGGGNPQVRALAVSGSDLYVGGEFTTAGGSAATNIAKWNESGWSVLGSGIGGGIIGMYVSALAVSGTNLYVAGYFFTAGGTAANNIAKWNGSSWSALGSGVSAPPGSPYYHGYVSALAVSGTNLYAGGGFTTAGGGAATNIARWDGTNWSALGSGMNSSVSVLAVSGSDIYAGGEFTTAGGNGATNIAKWNGSSWSALGSGMWAGFRAPHVSALAVSGSNLYAGGSFTTAGGTVANYIATWNGSSWSALGSGMDSFVIALAVSGSDVYAGGWFTTAGGSPVNYIARWNGSSWSPLGSGVNYPVYALAVSGSDLYAGGSFTTAGGSAANYVAKWTGSSWSPLGSGMNYSVYALAVSGSHLYAGGGFTTAGGSAATNIAKWNGSSWSALASGMNDAVLALAVSGSDVYAGGWFTMAGDGAANAIAKWDGSSWLPLGSGVNGIVYALAVSGADLYAGGDFRTAGGSPANAIAKWDGSSWSALGSGINGNVYALAVSGSDVYVGGGFTTAGDSPANCIAKWNGWIWSALGSGIEDSLHSPPHVQALAVSGTNLYAGGSFTAAGGKVSAYVAEALIPAAGGRFSSLASSPTRGFGFTFSDGTPGQYYLIQASPSLAEGSWINWLGFTYTGPITLTDPSPLTAPRKFYRAVWAP